MSIVNTDIAMMNVRAEKPINMISRYSFSGAYAGKFGLSPIVRYQAKSAAKNGQDELDPILNQKDTDEKGRAKGVKEGGKQQGLLGIAHK